MSVESLLGKGLKTVLGLVTGGISDRVMEIVDEVVGPDMTPEQRATLKISVEQEITKREKAAHDAADQAERNLNDRIAAQEGTAADLQQMPIVGRLVLFARGSQRPVWGFAVLFMDMKVFSGAWKLETSAIDGGLLTVQSAFWVINFLVLGFLFGERAVKNVIPLISAYLGKQTAKTDI